MERYSPGYPEDGGGARAGHTAPGYGMPQGPQFQVLRQALGDSVRWLDTDLHDGVVPAAADLLMVLAPRTWTASRCSRSTSS